MNFILFTLQILHYVFTKYIIYYSNSNILYTNIIYHYKNILLQLIRNYYILLYLISIMTYILNTIKILIYYYLFFILNSEVDSCICSLQKRMLSKYLINLFCINFVYY